MKKIKKAAAVLVATIISMAILTGCGAKFDIDNSDLESYATKVNADYGDVSSDYSSYDEVDGVYVMATDTYQIELWDLSSTTNGAQWFAGNLETLKDESSSNVGSNTTKSGDYTFTIDDTYYRLMFCEDKGIYAYGDKEDLVNALIDLGVITKK